MIISIPGNPGGTLLEAKADPHHDRGSLGASPALTQDCHLYTSKSAHLL